MVDEKQSIILEEGQPVELLDINGTIIGSTKALIGKASKHSYSEISLESYRSGQFLPGTPVSNGVVVHLLPTDEYLLVIATMQEVIDGVEAAIIARMVECNSLLTATRIVETADDRGNRYRQVVTLVEDLRVYVFPNRYELDQYRPGQFLNAEYQIYAPLFDIEDLDTVVLSVNGHLRQFKVVGIDPFSFRGIALIYISTETRK